MPNLPSLLANVIADGFDFVSVPLVHPRNRRDSAASGVSAAREGAFTRSDLLMPSTKWTRSVVGKLSPWLWPAIESSGPNGEICPARRNAEDALRQELAWASHLSLPAVLFPQLPAGDCSNTARLINQCVQQMPHYQIWITVPLADWSTSTIPAIMGDGPVAVGNQAGSPWARWNRLRELCEHSPALFVGLELATDLPSDFDIARWEGEPVKVLLIPTSTFVLNKKGFPVLTKRHQAVLRRFARFNVQMLVTGRPHHASGRTVYQQYLRHVHASVGTMTEEEVTEQPYHDYLQAPLQPLMDNLESQTYETFEKDPVKYEQYRKAVALSLIDIVRRRHPSTPMATCVPTMKQDADASDDEYEYECEQNAQDTAEEAVTGSASSPPQSMSTSTSSVGSFKTCEVVLMVVGAGRGPLVKASLLAAKEVNGRLRKGHRDSRHRFLGRTHNEGNETQLDDDTVAMDFPSLASTASSSGTVGLRRRKRRSVLAMATPVRLKLRVFAVEKNPNAIVTLRSRALHEGWGNVTVVSEDMRRWVPPRGDADMADVMVSELLGSFGDNELSPECLDGAQRFLAPPGLRGPNEPGGVSIPVDYVSYLAPVAASKLWNEAKHSKTLDPNLKAFETPYVVLMHNVKALETPQRAFTFEHPNLNWPDGIDNSR